jgi:hypothetical protein
MTLPLVTIPTCSNYDRMHIRHALARDRELVAIDERLRRERRAHAEDDQRMLKIDGPSLREPTPDLGYDTNSSRFLPFSRSIQCSADSPRARVSSVTAPSRRTRIDVFTHRPRT